MQIQSVFPKTILFLAALMIGLATAPAADAATGWTTATVNLRSGPGVGYRVIAVVPGGSAVDILDCASRRNWCRVAWRGVRGWISRRYLSYGRTYRPVVPIPPFFLFDYGYRDWRWDRDHDRWHRTHPEPPKVRTPRKPRTKSPQSDWRRDHDRWHVQRPQPRRVRPDRDDDRRTFRSPRQEDRRRCPPGDPRCR